MKRYIQIIIIAFLTAYSNLVQGAQQDSVIRRLLIDVQSYLTEKPDSAMTVLNSYKDLALQEEETAALYAVLITKAEYIATDTIISDSLIQKAVDFYNKEVSLESALASYYHGCYYFGRDYDKASYAFQNSIDYTPDGNDDHKGRAYHALGSCHFANGNIEEGTKAYKTALSLLDEKEGENTWKLCQNIKNLLNHVNRSKRGDQFVVLFILFVVLLLVNLCVVIYLKVKKSNSNKDAKRETTKNPLEQKLNEGKQAFEKTSAYRILQEIRSLNENELRSRADIDARTIEDAVLISFNDAYHILAEIDGKISHQDLMLCLYGYLKLTNNVAALCLKSVPNTIRQRKNRLKGKLPENVHHTLFS